MMAERMAPVRAKPVTVKKECREGSGGAGATQPRRGSRPPAGGGRIDNRAGLAGRGREPAFPRRRVAGAGAGVLLGASLSRS